MLQEAWYTFYITVMAHIRKRIHHHLKKHRSHITLASSLLIAFFVLGGTFFITRTGNPHISELAFTEHSSLGTQAGSVIPASCESGVDHGVTQTCWDGSVISSCSSCAPQPASCSASGPLSWGAGCSTYYSGSAASGQSITAYNSAAGYSGYIAYSCNNGSWGYAGESCTADPAPVNGACPSYYGPNGYEPINGCSSGSLGANAQQPNGDYHWYCNGSNGGAQSGLCYYVPPPVVNGTCSTYGAKGNTPINGCNTGTLGSNAQQPNGDYHWYCNGQNGGSTSGLCYNVPSYCPTGQTWNGSTCVVDPPTCSTGYSWNGSSCVANACSNGAVDAPTCATCPANYVMSAGTCTPITVSVSATNPYSTNRGATNTFTFTPSTNSGTTDCRLLDNTQAPLTAYATNISSINYVMPTTNGTYGYYIQCRNSTYTSVTSISNLISVTVGGGSCAALPTQTWGTSCSATVPGAADGGYSPVSNTAGNGYTGSATWTCNNGTWTGPTDVVCTAPIPPSMASFNVTPRSVEIGGDVKISWSILNPSTDPAKQCKIVATIQKPAVCDATCQSDRNTAQNTMNSILSTGTTNANDPNGANRNIPAALNTKVGGTQTAKGEKNIKIDYSTTFTASCGSAFTPVNSIIYVTNRIEG